MKAWRINGFGLANLTLEDIAIPEPQADELLIKVSAVSLNFRDIAILEGYYLSDIIQKGLIPVSDAVDTVVQTGTDITKFKAGDRVTSLPFADITDESAIIYNSLGGPINGGLAEYMVIKENCAAFAPVNLTDEETSTLPIAALTAWYSLVNKANVQQGDTVLVKGTGGVSLFGVQFAKALGAKVLLITGSDDKGEAAKAIGVTDFINYNTNPAWETDIRKLTGNVGVTHILEVVGGQSLNKSVKAIQKNGNIILIGFLESPFTNLDLMNFLISRSNIRAVSSVSDRNAFETMIKTIEQHNIKPVIDTVYNFDEAKTAYQHLQKGVFGKIVINMQG